MSKKYWDGPYNINTDWGGDDSTENLPLPGSAVQKLIKDELSKKVGYIYKDEQKGSLSFYGNEQDKIDGNDPLAELQTVARYIIKSELDINNQYSFLSDDKNKKIVWYFKTIYNGGNENETFNEDIIVDYNFNNTSYSKTTSHSMVIPCQNDLNNKGFTKVEINLDDFITDGNTKLTISIKGSKTKITQVLNHDISVINFKMKDITDFSKSFKDGYITILSDIICTKGQDFFIEYRFNNDKDFIPCKDKNTTMVNIDIKNLKDGKNVIEYRAFVNINNIIIYTDIQRIEFIKNSNNLTFDKPQILIFSTYSLNEEITDNNGDLIINGVSQYVPYSLKYCVYNENGLTDVEFFEPVQTESEIIKTDVINNQTSNNEIYTYKIQSLTSGKKKIQIDCRNVDDENIIQTRIIYFNIIESELGIEITTNSLVVDFNSIGKNNNTENKDVWESNVDVYHYEATFNNFNWAKGWTDNGLVITKDSEVVFNYTPFNSEYINGKKDGGYTIEFEFMTQNVIDESAVVCDMMSDGKGLLITGSEFKFIVSESNFVSTRFKENEMNRIALVFKPYFTSNNIFRGLIELYVNGVLSNIAKYDENYDFSIYNDLGELKQLSFKSFGNAELCLKHIRALHKALTDDEIVNNYILFKTNSDEMLKLYNKNNVLGKGSTKITYEAIQQLGTVPMLIFVGRTEEGKVASGENIENTKNIDDPYVRGDASVNKDDWYKTLEDTSDKKKNVFMDVIYYNPLDKSKNFKLVKAYITPQGTSSMYYPKKNYRIYTQKTKDTRMFVSNGDNILELNDMMNWYFGENGVEGYDYDNEKAASDRQKYEIYRGQKNYKKRLYAFKDNARPVKCWCLKADFAETSSSHNTGIARLWNDTLKNTTVTLSDGKTKIQPLKTKAQEMAQSINNAEPNKIPDVRTTIDGFPIVVFGAKSYSEEFTFLGKYNFNNDKSTEAVFGFCDIDNEENFDSDAYDYVNDTKSTVKYTIDNMLDKYMTCVETLDNGNAIANFSNLSEWYKIVNEEKGKKGWENAFEFRYPEIPEAPEAKDYQDDKGNWINKDKYEEDLKEFKEKTLPSWENNHLKPFKHFADWVYSTRWCDINGKKLPEITSEEAQMRKEKFAKEKWDHLDVWKVAAYYIYLMRFGAVDQVVKNSMLTSEGPFAIDSSGNTYGYWDSTNDEKEEYGKYYKWYYINYDNDTIMGVKNDGSLVYGPEIDRRSTEGEGNNKTHIYAGSNSTLWNNLEMDEEFLKIVRLVDQGISKTLTYANAIEMFDIEQVGKWCERIYNKDAEYKYISPYQGDWEYSGDDDITNTGNVFKDKLFMLQGSRTAHRHWWLSKRFGLYDGKWGSGDFKSKFIEVKCNSGQIGDTFSAKVNSKGYFGYEINNTTFVSDDPNKPWKGGEVYEFNTGDIIEWELFKVINIGDPIGIFGFTEMSELNLQGLSKQLRELTFNLPSGNNDIKNRIDTLILSIPEELLKVEAYYQSYYTDDNNVENTKDSWTKFSEENNNVKYENFENNVYPTVETEYSASDSGSPEYYRIKVSEDDYVYYAKRKTGIRNTSFTGMDFGGLELLKTLKVAGYTGLKNLDLSRNRNITELDARYSGIKEIVFAEGANIKNLLVSSSLNTLSFNRCNNITLDDIIIDNTPIKETKGNNIKNINIINSDGFLNQKTDFKTFLFEWIKNGVGGKSLTLKGINWIDVNVNELKDILESKKYFNESKLNLNGIISMGPGNIGSIEAEIIDEFRQTFKEVTIRIPYPNIIIKLPTNTIIAGEDLKIGYEMYSDAEGDKNITYSLLEKVNEKTDYSDVNGNNYQMIEASKLRNETVTLIENTIKTEEEITNENTNTIVGVFLNGIKFDVAPLTILDPTYANAGSINGESLLNEKEKEYKYELVLITKKGLSPIGTEYIEWEYTGDTEYVIINVSDDKKTLTITTKNELPAEDVVKQINLTVKVRHFYTEEGNYDIIIERKLMVINENVVLTETSNPVAMKGFRDYASKEDNNFILGNSEILTKNEALKFGIEEKVNFNDVKFDNSIDWSFDEFKYFLNVTKLTENSFANSKITSIIFPETNNFTLSEGVFANCEQLKTVKLCNSISSIPSYTFFKCKSLEDFVLPDNVNIIKKYAFGGTGIERFILDSSDKMNRKTIYFSEKSLLQKIEDNAFETDDLSISEHSGTVISNNTLKEFTFPNSLVLLGASYNFLLGKNLTKVDIPNNTNHHYENNIIFNNDRTEIFRVIDKELIEENLILSNVKTIHDLAFYNSNSIKSLTLGENLNPAGLGLGVFFDSKIEHVDLSECTKLNIIEDYTFYNTPKLKSVLLPEKGKLNTLGYQLFYNSQELSGITIPNTVYYTKNGKMKGDEKDGYSYLFENCGIESLRLPDNLQLKYHYYIKDCKKLKEFYFPKNHIFRVDDKYEIVTGCESLETVHLPIFSRIVEDDNTYFVCKEGKIVSGPFINKIEAETYALDTNLSVETRLSGTIITNENFYARARFNSFKGCDNFKSYVIHEEDKCNIMVATNSGVDGNEDETIITGMSGSSIIRIGKYNIETNEIVKLDNPKLVKLSNGSTSYITPNEIKDLEEGAFSHCSITNVVLPNDLEQINNALFAKSKLEKIELPSTITKINSEAFAGSNIRILTLPENVISLGDNVFLGCSKLEEVILNNKLESIGKGCFDSSTLRKINLNNNLRKIHRAVFFNCKNLEYIYIPKSVEFMEFSANQYEGIFEKCIKLKHVVNLSSANIPERFCFDCTSLSKVELLSDNIMEIGQFSFNGCNNLSNIIICTNNPPKLHMSDTFEVVNGINYYKYHPFGFREFSFTGISTKDKNILQVPNGAKEFYENDENWVKPLLMDEACGFKVNIIEINSVITLSDISLKDYPLIYSSISSIGITNEGDGEFIFIFTGNVYHNDEIIIYEDIDKTKYLGSFVIKYGEKNYTLNNKNLGVNNMALFNSNLFSIKENEYNKDTEMANITRLEYEIMKSKIDQLSKLIKFKK